jgi:hypothetical protein
MPSASELCNVYICRYTVGMCVWSCFLKIDAAPVHTSTGTLPSTDAVSLHTRLCSVVFVRLDVAHDQAGVVVQTGRERNPSPAAVLASPRPPHDMLGANKISQATAASAPPWCRDEAQ